MEKHFLLGAHLGKTRSAPRKSDEAARRHDGVSVKNDFSVRDNGWAMCRNAHFGFTLEGASEWLRCKELRMRAQGVY